jgi:hypothetical protein
MNLSIKKTIEMVKGKKMIMFIGNTGVGKNNNNQIIKGRAAQC